MRTPTLLLALTLSASISCQTTDAGFVPVSLVNTTGQGSPTLDARVYYPATADGLSAPMAAPPAGGFPVVVFLHGFTQLGDSYEVIGADLARRGYVIVLNNSSQFSVLDQVAEAKAYFSALGAASAQAGGFFEGALDLTRAALSGHSIGASNTIQALTDNPGYRCGFVLAPVDPGQTVTAQVDVPMCVIQGEGDTILSWAHTGLAVYNDATNASSLRLFYRMGPAARHNNVAGLFLADAVDEDMWHVSRSIMRGFLDRYLLGEQAGLEGVIGDEARAEPALSHLHLSIESPQLWTVGDPGVGQVVQVRLASEPGPAVLLFAGALGATLPTPLGFLQLDPTSVLSSAPILVGADRYATLPIAIPANPALVGFDLAVQGLGRGTGTTTNLGVEFSDSTLLTVTL
jgi:dienelactone hydrolase